jgi:AAA+ ATPase superfamily predicted ATPase
MPFQLTPVTGKLLIDREEELQELVSELAKQDSRMGFSLVGVRRVGKTSILFEAADRLRHSGVVAIYISVWEVIPSTLESFLSTLVDKTMDAFHEKLSLGLKFRDMLRVGADSLREVLSHVKVSAGIHDDLAITLSYVRGESKNETEAVSHAFGLVDKMASATQSKCVLIIDEFPSLAELKTGQKMVGTTIFRAVRTVTESYRKTAIVVSGSLMHTIQSAVLSHGAPLYGQLANMEIKPLREESVADFVKEYLKVEAEPDGLASLAEQSGGLPYNLQMLGRELELRRARKLDAKAVRTAVEGVLKREGDIHFRAYLERLTPNEVGAARALAHLPAATPKDLVDECRQPLHVVTALIHGLHEKGIVLRVGRGEYRFVDPMFAHWLNPEW